jgi:putative chitinase
MDTKTLALAAGLDAALALKWAQPLTDAMSQFSIHTKRRQAHFLAQVGHESGGFKRLVENLNYSAEGLARTWPSRFSDGTGPNPLAYSIARNPEAIANAAYSLRMGNNDKGDGWKYRGRGLMQMTGKNNYAAARTALGVDFVAQPELLELPQYAALAAGWFWRKNGLNEFADADDIERITRRVNGGLNGLDDRKARYAQAVRALAT